MKQSLPKHVVLDIKTPNSPLPVIFDSPHSGTLFPDDFSPACDKEALNRTIDSHVHELFLDAPRHGATLLHALFPRAYIDVNRARDDIDETLFEGAWPEEEFGTIRPTARSDSGIGLISRLVKPGTPIYDHPLSPEDIMHRVTNYYDPYHDALCTALDQAYYNHGQFWHINCHSMPSSSAYPKRNIQLIGVNPKASDIVIGDRDGTTSSRAFVHEVRDFWKELGYRVTINDPYKGVELIAKYSQPTRGKNSIQIEINRALYMDEENGNRGANFKAFKDHCTDMIQLCTTFAQSNLTRVAAD